MPAIVTLLRGVNVGAANRMRMDALRGVYESIGIKNPITYLQSGNVLFRAPSRGLASLPARIETAIEQACGFRPAVIARTAAEMREIVSQNPFAAQPGIDPAKLLVSFLAREVSPEAREKLLQLPPAPEVLHLTGKHLFIYYPNGMARPKLSGAAIDRILKMPATGRNWNSVTAMLQILETLGRD